ncbi:MAG: energy transducer TonB [Bacteroidetes bacterium]|nr:energy transducer TonB [Bacteroidota bacterium]
MKIYSLLPLLLLINYSAMAQKTEAFYDYYWKPCKAEGASYFSTVEKTDSGWLRNDYYISTKRLQMQALYEDQACKIRNGNSSYYYANGYASAVGRYVHGKREGICFSYHSNGMISDSAFFHNDQVVDKRFRWHLNGYMADSISRTSENTCVQVGWFDDGSPAYAGRLVNDQQEGKWKYYHHNGQLSANEMYSAGKLISVTYFDENGKEQTDTSSVNEEASFNGGEKAWIKYLQKKLYWPANLQFTTAGAVTVGIDFVIDETGKITNAEVSMPFHSAFDKIALDIIKSSPAWQPAVSHNRKVKAYRRQPITFVQPE